MQFSQGRGGTEPVCNEQVDADQTVRKPGAGKLAPELGGILTELPSKQVVATGTEADTQAISH